VRGVVELGLAFYRAERGREGSGRGGGGRVPAAAAINGGGSVGASMRRGFERGEEGEGARRCRASAWRTKGEGEEARGRRRDAGVRWPAAAREEWAAAEG
jgi:hypothetical protein